MVTGLLRPNVFFFTHTRMNTQSVAIRAQSQACKRVRTQQSILAKQSKRKAMPTWKIPTTEGLQFLFITIDEEDGTVTLVKRNNGLCYKGKFKGEDFEWKEVARSTIEKYTWATKYKNDMEAKKKQAAAEKEAALILKGEEKEAMRLQKQEEKEKANEIKKLEKQAAKDKANEMKKIVNQQRQSENTLARVQGKLEKLQEKMNKGKIMKAMKGMKGMKGKKAKSKGSKKK